MNPKPPRSRWLDRCLLLTLAGLLLGGGPVRAQTPPAAGSRTNRPPSERYLLIVETSAATQKRAENIQRVVGHLFSSGLRGELDPGDTIGAWTYDETLHTGQLPLQRWTPQTRQQITVTLVQFLQSRQFQKTARLDRVLEMLTTIVTNSHRITILLISDGSDARLGTPFDEKIAAAYKAGDAEQRQQQMPFVTVLRAEDGKYVGFTVSTPPWPVEFPAFPSERRPGAAPPVPAPTNPPPPEPVVVPPPLEKPPEPPAAVPATATNAAVEITNPPPVATALPVETPSATNAPPTDTNPPPVAAPAEPEPPVVATAATPEAPAKSPRVLLWALGGVGFGVIVTLLFFLLRPRHPAPRVSLITRSMNKDAK